MRFKPTLQEPTEVAELRAKANGRRSELQATSNTRAGRAELREVEKVLRKIDQGNTAADAAGFALARSLGIAQ